MARNNDRDRGKKRTPIRDTNRRGKPKVCVFCRDHVTWVDYKDADLAWVAIGDENYGEGSSREHAAMEPRYMGAKAVIVRSFARIHETNLKKQGVLPLVFSDPATYDEIGELDRISILGLAGLAPDQPVTCRLHRSDGSALDFTCTHTLSEEHIAWFRAGSALNLIRRRFGNQPFGG